MQRSKQSKHDPGVMEWSVGTRQMDPGNLEVSVVTVVFNGAAYVAETIESVLAQEGVACEYWVIDGGSTDGTLDIIRGFEARLTGWISEPDRGIADAFNKGLERAHGDYIMFLNADDALAHPHALEQLLSLARKHDWPDVVYGDCDLYDPTSGELLYRVIIDYERERFINAGNLPHPGMLMHRRYFERFGTFDTSYKVAMDYELLLRGVPALGALHASMLVTRVRANGISARSRDLVVEETIRALAANGYLSRFKKARLRASYALRGAARRMLEQTGLYSYFDAARRRRRAGLTSDV